MKITIIIKLVPAYQAEFKEMKLLFDTGWFGKVNNNTLPNGDMEFVFEDASMASLNTIPEFWRHLKMLIEKITIE